MANERERYRSDNDQYLKALGKAMMCFARAEWAAVYCCKCFDRTVISQIRGLIPTPSKKGEGRIKHWNSGDIAVALVRFAKNDLFCPPGELLAASEEFQAVVKERNRLFHAKPCWGGDVQHDILTDPNTAIWTSSSIDAAADRFAASSIELNGLWHKYLKAHTQD